jgi:hypothetical protein
MINFSCIPGVILNPEKYGFLNPNIRGDNRLLKLFNYQNNFKEKSIKPDKHLGMMMLSLRIMLVETAQYRFHINFIVIKFLRVDLRIV